MECNGKTITPSQTLILGVIEAHGEQYSTNGYRKYVVKVNGGPPDYPQDYEIEVKKIDECKLQSVEKGTPVEILCWVNGKAWRDRIFTNLTMIHLNEVAQEPAVEDEEVDLSFEGDDEDLPF
jgi:hypothetical protein